MLVMEDVMTNTYTVCITNRFEAARQVRSFESFEAARKFAWTMKRQFCNNDYMIFEAFMTPKSRGVWNSITASAAERDAA